MAETAPLPIGLSARAQMLDQCRLADMAKACAARKRWALLLTVAPLRVKGGAGSPVNPIATF